MCGNALGMWCQHCAFGWFCFVLYDFWANYDFKWPHTDRLMTVLKGYHPPILQAIQGLTGSKNRILLFKTISWWSPQVMFVGLEHPVASSTCLP